MDEAECWSLRSESRLGKWAFLSFSVKWLSSFGAFVICFLILGLVWDVFGVWIGVGCISKLLINVPTVSSKRTPPLTALRTRLCLDDDGWSRFVFGYSMHSCRLVPCLSSLSLRRKVFVKPYLSFFLGCNFSLFLFAPGALFNAFILHWSSVCLGLVFCSSALGLAADGSCADVYSHARLGWTDKGCCCCTVWMFSCESSTSKAFRSGNCLITSTNGAKSVSLGSSLGVEVNLIDLSAFTDIISAKSCMSDDTTSLFTSSGSSILRLSIAASKPIHPETGNNSYFFN